MVPKANKLICILASMLVFLLTIPAFAANGIEDADQPKRESLEQTECPEQTEQSDRQGQTEQSEHAEQPEETEQQEQPEKAPVPVEQVPQQEEAAGQKEQTDELSEEEMQNDEEVFTEPSKSVEAPMQKAVSALPENNTKVSYTAAGSHPVKFTVTTASGYMFKGTCATLGVDNSKSGTATVKRISSNSRIAKLVYYYGYKKGWWVGENSSKSATDVIGFTDKNCTENAKQCIEALIQRDNMGWENFWAKRKVGKYRMYSTDSFMKAINNIYNNTDVSKITIPDNVQFEMFHGVTSSDLQDFYVWRYKEIPVTPNGYVAVEKVSGDVSITQ